MEINSREELISAYLDSELDAEQQQRAERLLASDKEAARLLEEFRTVRSSLRTLPTFTLDDDFSQQVVQRAEQALADEGDPSPVAEQTTVQRPDPRRNGDRLDKRDMRRPLLWSALTIAAAIMITVYYGAQQNGSLAVFDADQEQVQSSASDNVGRGAAPAMSAEMDVAATTEEQPKMSAYAADEVGSTNRQDSAGPVNQPLRPATARAAPDADTAWDSIASPDRPGAAKGKGERKGGKGKNKKGGLESSRESFAARRTGDVADDRVAREAEEGDGLGMASSGGVEVYTYAVLNHSAYRRQLGRALDPKQEHGNQNAARQRLENSQSGAERKEAVKKLSALAGVTKPATVRRTATGTEYVYELEGTPDQIRSSLSRLDTTASVQLVNVTLRDRAKDLEKLAPRQQDGKAAASGSGAQSDGAQSERADSLLDTGGAVSAKPADPDVALDPSDAKSAAGKNADDSARDAVAPSDSPAPPHRATAGPQSKNQSDDRDPQADNQLDDERDEDQKDNDQKDEDQNNNAEVGNAGQPATVPSAPDGIGTRPGNKRPADEKPAAENGAVAKVAGDVKPGDSKTAAIRRVLLVFRVEDPRPGTATLREYEAPAANADKTDPSE